MSLDDPAVVEREYASESGLAARRAVHTTATGPDATQIMGALEETVRVSCPRGRLVAATNYADHMRELRELVPAMPPTSAGDLHTSRARELLAGRFARVAARDAFGTITFADRDAVLANLEPCANLLESDLDVPELEAPLIARRRAVVLVADK